MIYKLDSFYAFLDIETTGHNPLKLVNGVLAPWHEIIEIGLIISDCEILELGEFEVKIRPEYPERCLPKLVNDYPQRAKNGEWKDSVHISVAMARLIKFCEGFKKVLNLAGHNFSFDWSFLVVAFAQCGISEDVLKNIFHYARIDVRSMAVQKLQDPNTIYNPSDYSLRNETLAQKLGIRRETYPHQAINGARQSLLVFKKLQELE